MERSSSIVDALQGQSPEAHILEASRKTDGFRSGLSSEVVRWSKTGRLCSKDEVEAVVVLETEYDGEADVDGCISHPTRLYQPPERNQEAAIRWERYSVQEH